jgi:GH24 family phage-related lysozyme (muramidase)
VKPHEWAAAAAHVRRNEGTRYAMYRDTLGIPTIGVGFNLRRPDARDRLAFVGAGLDAVLAGEVLTPGQVDKLLEIELNECVADLRVLLPSFDGYPTEAKLVLVDLRYNLGPKKLRAFRFTLQAVRERQWAKVAAMLEPTLWARQVGPRATRACAMLRRIEA